MFENIFRSQRRSLSKGTVFYHPITKNLQYINLIDVLILDL